MDWNLRTCGRRGHVTYAPDEPALRRNLHATTPLGEAWRCLRCGTYVLGPPQGIGIADQAPLVLRGRELRDSFVLRVLAIERGARGLLLLVAAYGVWHFRTGQQGLLRVVNDYLPLLKPIADRIGYDLENSGPMHLIRRVLSAREATLEWITLALVVYALLELTESIGLWLLKRWGEYLAAAATSLFLPIEAYELYEKVTGLRIGALVFNILAVIYLVWTKRLFGARGGGKAYAASRREASLLEVEEAGKTVGTGQPAPSAAGSAPATRERTYGRHRS